MKEVKYSGKYLEITEENIEGHIYERVKVRSGVTVFPEKDGKILMIKEFRQDEGGRSTWRFVSGWVDKEKKDTLEHAKEELAEEVSFESEDWENIEESCVKGTVESRIDYFLARDVKELEVKIENPDGDIIEETKWVSEEEFLNLLDEKKVDWRRSSLVALMVFRILQK